MPTAATLERRDPGGSPSPHLDLSLLGGFSIVADDEPCEVPEGSQRLPCTWRCRAARRAGPWWRRRCRPEDRPRGRRPTSGRRCGASPARWRPPSCTRSAPTCSSPSSSRSTSGGPRPPAGRDPGPAERQRRRRFDAVPARAAPGLVGGWVLFERERIAQLQFHFLEALTDGLLATGRSRKRSTWRCASSAPIPSGREAIGRCSLSTKERNIGQARRHFESFRMLIRETFGCEPSPRLREW